jgi:hypothetical protein
MIERTGFAEDIAAYDAAAGDVDAMGAAISDEFIADLAAIGQPDEVSAGVARYREAGASSPCVGPIARMNLVETLRAGIGG